MTAKWNSLVVIQRPSIQHTLHNSCYNLYTKCMQPTIIPMKSCCFTPINLLLSAWLPEVLTPWYTTEYNIKSLKQINPWDFPDYQEPQNYFILILFYYYQQWTSKMSTAMNATKMYKGKQHKKWSGFRKKDFLSYEKRQCNWPKKTKPQVKSKLNWPGS